MKIEDITAQTAIDRVIADIDFSPWGRLIFPADSGYWSGTTLGSLLLRWYSHIDAAKTVEIIRYFKAQSLRGEPVFFDIYTEVEKQRDPRKRNTGLFFFRGKKGAKVQSAVQAAARVIFSRSSLSPQHLTTEMSRRILPAVSKN